MKEEKDACRLRVADDPGGDGSPVGREKPASLPGKTKVGRNQREKKADGMEDSRGADESPEKTGPQQGK